VFFANSFDFIQIKQRNQLSENGLSKKVATFIHVILVRKTKLHLKREILYGDPAFQKVLSDTSDLKEKNSIFELIIISKKWADRQAQNRSLQPLNSTNFKLTAIT
jgi:hypothetical protein